MTDRDRFRRVEAAFHELSELAGSDRDRGLETLRGEAPDIADEVERLLARDQGTGPGSQSTASAPASIGPYRLLRRLGTGGMGEVWEAEQTEPVRRRVALKLVRSGFAGDEVLRRFRAEREAMARMSHPGIAQVFDAGAAADGRPYVVMELVDGEPVTDYCDRRGLGLRARLELVAEICRAVQHAHQKGVIHRDLKPSNILVAQGEGRPLPKIIDFGIARALEDDEPATRMTRLGDVLGTLEYMSPEQASGAAAEVDTRTDVYALGVVLYELLTGSLPLSADELAREGLEAALRQIRETDPPTPSTRMSDAGRRVTSSRGGDRSTLRRELRGDLDWITMKALAKQTDRRYPSASELAADLDRHLRDEPVLAGPPSLAYRVGKLVRRHRVAAAAGAMAIVALVVAVIGITVGLVRATAAEREARREALAAEQVSGFLVDLFRSADPARARGADVTARELLDGAADRARQELDDAPEVRTRLLRTLGLVHEALGDYPTALELLEEAATLESDLGRTVDLDDRIETRLGLTRTHRGLDDLDAAAAVLADAERLLDRAVPADDPEWLPLLREQANLALFRRDIATARSRLERAASIVAGIGDRAEAGRLASEIGFLDYQEGDFTGARNRFEEALASLEAALGPDHPEVGTVLNDLAVVEKRLGNLDRALALHERGLALDERVLGPDHPDTGNRLQNICRLLVALDRAEDAVTACERARRIHETSLGPAHRMTVAALNGLGGARSATGDVSGARAAWSEGIERMAANPDTFYGYLPFRLARNLAMLERCDGRPEAAATVCRSAPTGALGERYPRERAEVELELAAALLAIGRDGEADELAAGALEVLDADTALDPWAAALHRSRYRALAGDTEAAREALDRALELGADHEQLDRDPDLAPLLAGSHRP